MDVFKKEVQNTINHHENGNSNQNEVLQILATIK